MPFDALPEGLLDDLAKLRVARDGVAGIDTWKQGALGGRNSEDHCLLGWLLVATEWDENETARLVVNYVWPALPAKDRRARGKMASVYKFNDARSRRSVVDLVEKAMELAGK